MRAAIPAALFVILGANSALSQNMYDWSGVYIGAHGGVAGGNYTPFSPGSGPGYGPPVNVDGLVGGGTVGFNWQHGYWVFGIEADISNGPEGTTTRGTTGPTWSCNSGDCNAEIEHFGTVRGRIGYANDNWLFFATAGYAFGEITGGIFNSAQQGGGTADGWAGGAGFEYGWHGNWTSKFEYLHVDLGDIPFGTGILPTDPFLGEGSFDVIRFGFNYRFPVPGLP